MNDYQQRGFDWGSFIIGILLVFVALYSFKSPITNLTAIVLVFAFSAITKGILQLIWRNRIKKYIDYSSSRLIFLGVINLLVGFILLVNMSASIIALPFVFAFWFILESIGEASLLPSIKKVSNSHFWLVLIACIINIVLGIFLLFKPLVAAFTLSWLVGTYFLVAGITYIVRSF
ncbi:MAG: DUF308 domain-containing protein [Vagococcus sp.]